MLQTSKELSADLAVVGGGIFGLAHAYHAAKAGKKVVLFERHPKALGASVRNFGMVWPMGQPAGRMHQLSMRSRQHWLEMLAATGLPYFPTGSLHVVYRDDERDVAQEFAALAPGQGFDVQWQTPAQVLERSHAVRAEGLLGGLWSPTEVVVDPRLIVAKLPEYLSEQLGVTLRYDSVVRRIELPLIEAGTERWHVEQAVVCAGDDFQTLYPESFANSGITRCKLQMLRTGQQPDGWQLGPSLAAGLTLRFYSSFGMCSTLAKLKERIAQETPELDRWAIHVLVSQTADGAITLGDSHEYGLAVDIFDRDDVDELILNYLDGFARFPSRQIAQRWHGVYAKHFELPYFRANPAPGVQVLTAAGGSGMTLSFGLAEETLSL
jgi:D-hydroxyproline dehydrogenase subunit beta